MFGEKRRLLKEVKDLQTKLLKLTVEHNVLIKRWNELIERWNKLVARVNAKGGESFLKGESSQFTQDEIKVLIKLCHPDKHQGIEDASTITRKLLTMRK